MAFELPHSTALQKLAKEPGFSLNNEQQFYQVAHAYEQSVDWQSE